MSQDQEGGRQAHDIAGGAPIPPLLRTGEGAGAFPIDNAMARLVYTYGSFLPESFPFYGTGDETSAGFAQAIRRAADLHPELVLQYAAWQRDPKLGKGNRSQPPLVLAILATIPACLSHPRFAELVAKCIVRPDDALRLVGAAQAVLSGEALPLPLVRGIVRGLDRMSEYQLVKYRNATLDLLPERRVGEGQPPALPDPSVQQGGEDDFVPALVGVVGVETRGQTLRLVDVLGMCKGIVGEQEMGTRLMALYTWLHVSTRRRNTWSSLQREIRTHFPILLEQRALRAHPPLSVQEVDGWVRRALEARLTMEQMLSSTGLAPGLRKRLRALTEPTEASAEMSRSEEQGSPTEEKMDPAATLAHLQRAEAQRLAIRAGVWTALMGARIADEDDPQRSIPAIGDTAFLRNVRGMVQAGVPLEHLKGEAARRHFSGIWPFQVLTAARRIEEGVRRGRFYAPPSSEVSPILDAIFERVALSTLPRKGDGTPYRVLGLADVSGSMTGARIGKKSTATLLDAAIAFSAAFSFTFRTPSRGGLAGTWSEDFRPAWADPSDGPLAVAEKVYKSGGWGGGGTEVFTSVLSLILWLLEHPDVPRPEVVVLFSDMQFHSPRWVDVEHLMVLPERFRTLVNRPAMRVIPPFAAAAVLYREVLGSEVSFVLWNLASYEGSPVPSGMERVLLLSGFDVGSMRILEQWLRAGSPGEALPKQSEEGVTESEQRESSIEFVLRALRQY